MKEYLCKYRSHNKICEEHILLEDNNAEEHYKHLINAFNEEELRRKESVPTYPIENS